MANSADADQLASSGSAGPGFIQIYKYLTLMLQRRDLLRLFSPCFSDWNIVNAAIHRSFHLSG